MLCPWFEFASHWGSIPNYFLPEKHQQKLVEEAGIPALLGLLGISILRLQYHVVYLLSALAKHGGTVLSSCFFEVT